MGGATIVASVVGGAALAGCSSSSDGASSSEETESIDKIVFIWEPTESADNYASFREAVAECIAQGAGVPCEMMTTTDYNVTIEALVSGQANMASLGASEYVEAHAKNPAVTIAFVQSNDEGELDQASYYAMFGVKIDDADEYLDADGNYSIENLAGKNFSFVSLNSTSGFVLPATVIVGQEGLDSTDELSESGSYFGTVLFPGSHPGALYNLMSGEADAAVFADYLIDPSVELVSGEASEVGAVYRVRDDAETPLDEVAGQEFVIIESLPVPAVPICINTDVTPADMVESIIEYMTSDEVANNPEIFADPDDAETVSNWTKTSDKICFVRADDSYYDEFREMIGFEG